MAKYKGIIAFGKRTIDFSKPISVQDQAYLDSINPKKAEEAKPAKPVKPEITGELEVPK